MPRIVDHEAMRARIIKGSFKLFAKKGYGTVGMREIAAGLKMSTGTLYHYFKNKKALFRAVVQEFSEADVREAVARIETEQDPAKRARKLLEFVEEREDYFRSFVLIATDYTREESEKNSPLPHILRLYREAISNHLGLSDEHASLLFSALSGAVFMRMLDPESIQWKTGTGLVEKVMSLKAMTGFLGFLK